MQLLQGASCSICEGLGGPTLVNCQEGRLLQLVNGSNSRTVGAGVPTRARRGPAATSEGLVGGKMFKKGAGSKS